MTHDPDPRARSRSGTRAVPPTDTPDDTTSHPDPGDTTMTTDLLDDIRRALRSTATVVDGIGADQLDAPTPCEGWTVRDVANHLVGGMHVFAALLAGDEADEDPTRDRIGTDLAGAFAEAAAADGAAWSAPGALDREVALSFATLPATMAGVIHLTELVVHGLDLAVATGRTDLVDDQLADDLLDRMRSMGGIDAFRAPGFFGPELPAVPGDPAYRRLLAYVGRDADVPSTPTPAGTFV